MNAWDDFHNHGLVGGVERLAVHLLNTGLNIAIGAAALAIAGPELAVGVGLGASIYIGEKIFNPWKESIK